MFRLRPTAAATLAVALGAARGVAEKPPSFDQHLEEHGLAYHGDEYHERKSLYEKAVEKVEKQNSAKGALWKAAVNKFSTMTEKEMSFYFGYMKTTEKKRSSGPQPPSTGTPPASFDWRDHVPNVVTPVKNQGSCGSCWAFAATEAMETAIALATGKLFDLSPQQLVSCMPNPEECGGSGGCMGATAQLAYAYTANYGITSIFKWPYLSGTQHSDQECEVEALKNYRKPLASINGYVQLPQNHAAALILGLVNGGPVTVSVAASYWGCYGGGIFDMCSHEDKNIINHAVVLMGYGHDHTLGENYWTIRNSWGVYWGENGYIRLLRAADGADEECHTDDEPLDGYSCASNPPNHDLRVCGCSGVLSDSSYPVNPTLGEPQGPPDDPAIHDDDADGPSRLFEIPSRESLPAAAPPAASAGALVAAASAAVAAVAAVAGLARRRAVAAVSQEAPALLEEGAELEPISAE